MGEEVKKDYYKNATDFLERVRKNLDLKTLNLLITGDIFLLVTCMVIFGWAWKNHTLLIASFVSLLFILVALFGLKRYFFPKEFETPEEEKKEGGTFLDNIGLNLDPDKFASDVMGESMDNLASEKPKKGKKKPIVEDSSSGLVSAEEYSKNAAKGFGFD